jgi:pimeloyl-ACP methyl ester carboxylesterase
MSNKATQHPGQNIKDLDLNALAKIISKVLTIDEITSDVQSCPVALRLEITGSLKKNPLNPVRIDLTATHTVEGARRPGDSEVVLSADVEVWAEFFQQTPKPGFHSIGALRRSCEAFKVMGSNLCIAQSLPLAERILDYARAALHPKQARAAHWDRSVLAQISGRYLCIDAAREEWVYCEQAGDAFAPVLLMLHTAGADSRQWHGLMGAKSMKGDAQSVPSPLLSWSMHAFDLPGHGRSPLPVGCANWDWTLTQEDYCRWILSYMDAQKIAKATLLGCSMGSAIGLVLLAKYPHRFEGAVLLEAPYCSRGRRSVYLNHAQVHGARLAAAWVGSLLAPHSEKSARDQATWIYSQGAPSVYDGDLAFYSDDFDAHHHTAQINTKKTPLWLLTGNYDYSASPEETSKIHLEVQGSHFVELKGFGHFPMIENPIGLLPYLDEPLRDILANRAKHERASQEGAQHEPTL